MLKIIYKYKKDEIGEYLSQDGIIPEKNEIISINNSDAVFKVYRRIYNITKGVVTIYVVDANQQRVAS